jgi:hypothetical protein
MQIEVNVSGAEGIDLNTELARRPVRRYLGDGDWDTQDEPYTLADMVAERLVEKLAQDERYPSLQDLVKRVRESVLREKLEPIIEDAINGPLQLTNEYGEARGPAITLREYIVGHVKKIITSSKRDHRGSSTSLLQEVVDNKLRTVMTNELKETFEAEKNKIKALIQAEGAKIMAEALVNAAEAVRPATKGRPVRDTPQA